MSGWIQAAMHQNTIVKDIFSKMQQAGFGMGMVEERIKKSLKNHTLQKLALQFPWTVMGRAFLHSQVLRWTRLLDRFPNPIVIVLLHGHSIL